MNKLVNVSDKSKGTSWPLEDGQETSIGRVKGCDICLADGGTSRRHCVILSGPGGFTVRDLNSANGTFVNGRRVLKAELKPGDRLRVGSVEMELRAETPADDAATRLFVDPVAMTPPSNRPATPATSATPGAHPPPEAPAPPAAIPAPVPVPVSVMQRRAPVAPSSAPAAAGRPAELELGLEFCSRCSGSIARTALGVGRARIVDGELLCADCLGRNSTRMGMAAVVEGPLAPPAPPRRTAPVSKPPSAPAAAPAARPSGAPGRARPARTSRAAARAASPGGQLLAWGGLAFSLLVLALCLVQMPDALLNFQRLLSPARVAMQPVPMEEVRRTPLGMAMTCTLRPEGGAETRAALTGGLLARLQYGDFAERTMAAGEIPVFEVVYDVANPARSALRDQLFGLPTLALALAMLCWAGWEAWWLSRLYLTMATSRAAAARG